jgi:3-oxoacyl-[acyl-carrier protein] reductase
MDLSLDGKVALVCGASQGIGKATAIELALLGCHVVALARNETKLQSLIQKLHDITGYSDHQYLAIDITQRVELESRIKQLIEQRGPIEILINNTGGPPPGEISKATENDFDQAFQNHLQVNALLSRLLLPGMKLRQYGRIINISSTSVKMPIPHLGVSNIARWAVTAWAKTLSIEVAPFGITVNNVLPGYTETPRLRTLIQDDIDEKRMRDSVPAKRFAKPKEIAAAVAFLASPAAAYINGVALPVDGGRTGCV